MKGSWVDELNEKLLGILKNEGVEKFLAVSKAMLAVDARQSPSMKAQFVGQVCETVLFGLTQEYIKLRNVKAACYASTVLKDLQDMQSSFRTELDFILCSPSFLLTTECKSYAGPVEIVGQGEFKHRGKSNNVYSQSLLHYKKLNLYAEQVSLPNLGLGRLPVFANAFIFSNSTVKDSRPDQCKSSLSVLTVSSLFGYYDRLFAKYKREVYDYQKACRVFTACSASKELHRQHKEFLGY